jgi:hypothetical protein
MPKGKGYQCPECSASTAKYEKGAYHCKNVDCGAVWWTAFDRPYAGEPRKGDKCVTCYNNTVHPIGEVAGGNIRRCSVCATTIVVAAK